MTGRGSLASRVRSLDKSGDFFGELRIDCGCACNISHYSNKQFGAFIYDIGNGAIVDYSAVGQFVRNTRYSFKRKCTHIFAKRFCVQMTEDSGGVLLAYFTLPVINAPEIIRCHIQ